MVEPNLWRVLEPLAPTLVYQRGSMIYWQGDMADRLYYLKRGKIRIFLASVDGAEHTLRIQQTGSVFGEAAFFDGGPRMSSARALEKSEIIAIPRDVLLDSLQREPGLAMAMMRALSARVRMLSSQMDSMAFLQADRRLARFLAESAPVIQCSHEELGERIGASRITITRAVQKLQQRGWIQSQYRAIRIFDPVALLDYANGETK